MTLLKLSLSIQTDPVWIRLSNGCSRRGFPRALTAGMILGHTYPHAILLGTNHVFTRSSARSAFNCCPCGRANLQGGQTSGRQPRPHCCARSRRWRVKALMRVSSKVKDGHVGCLSPTADPTDPVSWLKAIHIPSRFVGLGGGRDAGSLKRLYQA